MKPIHSCSVLFFVFCLIACDENMKKEVMVLPSLDNLEVYESIKKKDEGSPSPTSNPPQYTIVTFINGDCYYCINELNTWQEFINAYDLENKVLFNIYIYSIDFDRFKELMEFDNSLTIKFPLLLDINGSVYKTKVQDEGYSDERNAVLLNNKNEILVVGNPVIDKSVKDSYLSVFQKKN